MEKNKYTLITIIVLLAIFLPISIYGTSTHLIRTTNFKREFRFNGKLYFYDGKKLLGTYTCQNKNCDYAKYDNEEKSTLINKNYAFIDDGEIIKFVNVKSDVVIGTYEAVRKGDFDNYYVLKNECWGAIQITDVPAIRVDPNQGYTDVSYLNGKYIVKKDSSYMIIDNNKELFNTDYMIKDFNDSYIVVYDEYPSCPMCTDIQKEEYLYDYNNLRHFMDNAPISEIILIDNYFLIRNNYNYYLYTIIDNNEVLIDSFYYDLADKLDYELTDNSIIFKSVSGFEKTIEINKDV